MSEVHFRKLETMYRRAPINQRLEPSIAIDRGAATIGLDVRPELFHAAGAVHGSVIFKLLDDACFFAVSSLVEDVFVVTVSFTTYLVRPVNEGRLTAEGRVVHAGKNLFLAEAVVKSASGKEVGRGNGSFQRTSIALGPELGYVV